MTIKNNFNTADGLLVFTSMPAQKDYSAIGWHSRKTLKHLAESMPVVVCAEKSASVHEKAHMGKRVKILRTWDAKNPLSILNLLSMRIRFWRVKRVLVPFEFSVFGSVLANALLVVVLGILRLTGMQVTVEIHQVVTDILLLKKHIGIQNPYSAAVLNVCLHTYYRALGFVANNVVVFEHELEDRLSIYVPKHKIHTLSLAVERITRTSRTKARKLLGLPLKKPVIMLFGFINGYKGFDTFLKAIKNYAGDDFSIFIAGGPNPHLRTSAWYTRFYRSILKLIRTDSRIIHAGFVPDQQVNACFSAADVLVLPYEVFMSASGPFSLALSHSTPVVLSEALLKYARSVDIQHALADNGLKKSDLFFPLTEKGIRGVVHSIVTSSRYRNKLKKFVIAVAEKRSMQEVIAHYVRILTIQKKSTYVPALSLSLEVR